MTKARILVMAEGTALRYHSICFSVVLMDSTLRFEDDGLVYNILPLSLVLVNKYGSTESHWLVVERGENTAISSGASSLGRDKSVSTLVNNSSAIEEEENMGRIREVVGEALLVPRKDAIRKVSLPSRLALSSNLLGMKVSKEMSFAVVWKVEGSRVGRDFQVICSEFNNLQRSERLSAELGRQTTARVSKATRFVTLRRGGAESRLGTGIRSSLNFPFSAG